MSSRDALKVEALMGRYKRIGPERTKVADPEPVTAQPAAAAAVEEVDLEFVSAPPWLLKLQGWFGRICCCRCCR